MLLSVDFWKSMHGFAMDSRTRESFAQLATESMNLKNQNVSLARGMKEPQPCY